MRKKNRRWRLTSKHWLVGAATLLILLIYVVHMQLSVNGLTNPYTTDVGEIQNALPRWGTLHFTGYPQFTFLGSLFVTIVGWFGLAPAAGASLYSAVWGAISITLLILLIIELGIPTPLAILASLSFGLATSMWIDASIAELHTMTMALTFATLLAAVRFGKNGSIGYLYLMTFLVGQGIVHQRAFAFIGLGLLIMVMHRWRALLDWKRLFIVIGLLLLGPLTYLYLPLRAWMGADWTFSSPGTWAGFKAIVLDTKAERIISIPSTYAEAGERIREIALLLHHDWPLPLLLLGLLGIFLPGRPWRLRWGLTLAWIPILLVSLIIWEGRVSDALLAVKLPIIAFGAIGVAFWAHLAWSRSQLLGYALVVALLVFAGYLFVTRRDAVLAITQDESAFELIKLVDSLPPTADGRPQAFMALWGDDYWPLTYAQEYMGYFPALTLVQHDRNFATLLSSGQRLHTFSWTFYQRPISWWEERIGHPYLTSVAPEIVEIRTEPEIARESEAETRMDLGNGVAIRSASLEWVDTDTLHLSIDWQSQADTLADYSIAVHLVSQEVPAGPQDILIQADQSHPVAGWYPTSLWQRGEVVTDHFVLEIPAGASPAAVRVSMYQVLADGSFANTEWLTLPLP
jgi:hypothetical protein